MEEPAKKHKIGFCFLIKDQFYNQAIWKQFFENIPHDDYKIYIHYKKKCPMNLENHEFISSIPTKWGTMSLVQATFRLFECATADNCTIMFLLSSDTLPMQPYSTIKQIRDTIFRPMHTNVHKKTQFCLQNYNRISTHIKESLPFSKWRKQHMFFCMTSHHFNIIRFQPKLHHYLNVVIPDEYYFINQCTFLNIPYKTGSYIYVGQTNHQTQASNITNTHFKQNSDNIRQFLFIRKIVDYKQVPSYSNWFNHIRCTTNYTPVS